MMTPNGGVFGRNPKFNNVTVAGTLTASGAISAAQSITMGSGANLVMASGNGISFAATGQPAGMTSELLNDYEEGTWTPVVRGSTTQGTYETAYSQGAYTKIGRQVTALVNIRLAAAVTGGGVGALQIAGLPFTAASAPAGNGPYVLYHFGIAGSKDYTAMSISGSSTVITGSLASLGVDGTRADIDIANAGTNDELRVAVTYFT